VAERLREALNEGRIDLGEYDDRLKQAYAARTYGELDTLLHDLPAVAPPERSQVATTSPAGPPATAAAGPPFMGRQIPVWLQATWGSWLTASLVCLVIWLATDPHGYPWPVWVAGPWGAVLLARTIMALGSGDPEGYHRAKQERERQHREEKQARRQEHWDRRRERWERRERRRGR
jgi:hypothetical protein